MKVKVIKLEIDNIDKSVINTQMRNFFDIGEEYIVYGITVQKAMTYIQIYVDSKLISVPIELFDIIDSRVSKYWLISYTNSTIRFWPNEFYQEYFHDDLFEEVPKIVYEFRKIKNMIDNEFTD